MDTNALILMFENQLILLEHAGDRYINTPQSIKDAILKTKKAIANLTKYGKIKT